MASSMQSMFSTSCPPSPLPTDEEFNLYHSIDRQLYRKLIINLDRDIAESMNVMAFWLWLEQQSTGGMTLVKRMLSLPSVLINDLADESVLCLKIMEKDHFSYPENAYELTLLPDMLGRNIPLKFFYDRRITVLRGVTTMYTEVCARAFKDINQNALDAVTRRLSGQGGDVVDRRAFSFGGLEADSVARGLSDHRRAISFGGFDQAGSSMIGSVRPVFYTAEGLAFTRALEDERRMQQSQVVYDELSDIFSGNLNLQEEENNVCPDERTIFLTFSRGYPISEAEVGDFFSRKFGDFIEEIHMQPVPPGEQVLYARVVARSASMIDAVVKGGKAKYNINGKHVCVRKFVKKNQPSSSSSSEVTSAQSTPPLLPPDAGC